jgi:hypothetical protein
MSDHSVTPSAASMTPPSVAISPESKWDAEEALRHDRRIERMLLVKESVVIAIIVALIALRVLFVH